MKFRPSWRRFAAPLMALGLVVGLLGSTSATGTAVAAGSGKTMTAVEVNIEWPNLDPALDNQESIDSNLMNAIYGQLFKQNPTAGCPGGCKNPGAVVPDLAKGYTVSPDGRTVTIQLRKGLRFQDGTPLNAAAVKFNIERDLAKSSVCLCKTNFAALKSITTDGATAVQLHLSQRYVPLIKAFLNEAPNWMASPTAIKQMSTEAFGQKPVGAGPFEVVSNRASSALTLKAFPGYSLKGKPKLSTLKIITASNDNAALEALQAGTAQLLLGVASPQIINEARQGGFQVTQVDPIVTSTAELNNTVAPFNNLKAREALAYATDPKPIAAKLFPGTGSTAQSAQPTGQFAEKTVPGYRSYNLAKAKALVKQLGGLSFKYIFVGTPLGQNVAEALQHEWLQAGIHATLDPVPLTKEVADVEVNNWQALAGASGGFDPDVGVQSIPSRYASNGTFTCCHDKALDALINKSLTTTNTDARKSVFDQIYAHIAKNALSVNLYMTKLSFIASKNVTGLEPDPGEAPASAAVPWETLGMK
ncbi:MAG: ABC transporter substrate-binding protein [Acidimicrobiaceae bacterium]|nr:ABC transporter substrate-binding protein [Acidimicrobiaceae bacterium]